MLIIDRFLGLDMTISGINNSTIEYTITRSGIDSTCFP